MAIPSQQTGQERLVSLTLNALSKALGLESLPDCIEQARPEIFLWTTLEVTSFLIYYGHKYEQEEIQSKSQVLREWQEKTGCSLDGNRYIYRLITNVFNREIIGNVRPRPQMTFCRPSKFSTTEPKRITEPKRNQPCKAL